MKAISIIGSTGSVGVTTLDVVSRFPERFRVIDSSRPIAQVREELAGFIAAW